MQYIEAHLLTLGLGSCDSEKELKAAYYRQIKQWHPDRFRGDPTMELTATEHAKRINAAYEYLSELFEIGSLPRPAPRGSPNPPSKPQQTYRTQHTYNRKPFTTGFPDPDVFEVFVKSSHIISTGYSRASETLYIKFEGDVVSLFFDSSHHTSSMN